MAKPTYPTQSLMPFREEAAIFSPGRVYRYRLDRTGLLTAGGMVNFIMLNPSTADETSDDQTVRKCIGFAREWGFASLAVTNLFAFRATDPRELRTAADPVGPWNDAIIRTVADQADRIVVAWGALGNYLNRADRVRELLAGRELLCVGLTLGKEPRHPLYAPYGWGAMPA